MTYYSFLGFIAFLVLWHNVSEAARLRWRVMVSANTKNYSPAWELLIAALVFAVPTACLIAWSAISYRMLASDGDFMFAIGAWCAAVGLGAFFLLRGVFRSLQVYRELTVSK